VSQALDDATLPSFRGGWDNPLVQRGTFAPNWPTLSFAMRLTRQTPLVDRIHPNGWLSGRFRFHRTRAFVTS
jgi:hypothetical protein